MNDHGANIDLVFRNGLKDFEVLPPPEVWDNVRPAIKVKPRPFIYIRAAAMIALLLTISFLAYRWSREISAAYDNQVISFDVKSASPILNPGVSIPALIPRKVKNQVNKSQKTFIADIPENAILTKNENGSSPESVNESVPVPVTNNLSLGRAFSRTGMTLADMTAKNYKSFETEPVVSIERLYVGEEYTTKNVERWSIAAMASPTYYSSITSGNNELSKQIAASERSLLSYSGGVAVSYKLNKRFSIQTGLYYSSFGQEVDGINSFGGFQKYDVTKGDYNFRVLTTSGTVNTDNTDVFLLATGPGERILTAYTNDVFDPKKANLNYLSNTLLQNFSFLELPVVLRYKIVDKTININLIGGISYNMLVNNSAYAMADGGKYLIGKTEGFNLLTLSSSLGMGLGYNFSNKLSLNLEPTFRYYLNPFNDVTGSTNHPYSFGIFSGVSYKF
jgi:hypothetical protein